MFPGRPAPGALTWQNAHTLTWPQRVTDAEGWMRVATACSRPGDGWCSECGLRHFRQIHPLRLVLWNMRVDKQRLAPHGTLSCARIYIAGGRHVADLAAASLGTALDWSPVPLFDAAALGPRWPREGSARPRDRC
jgi:hypothetical protein